MKGFKILQFLRANKAEVEKLGVKLSGIDEPIKMSIEGKLEDGTVVASTADAFVEGAPIFVVDAEGNTTPAPDGEHKLEDGTTITVEGGMITTVVTAAPAEEEMSAEDIEKNLNALVQKLSEVSSENESLKAKITELEGTKAELSKVKTELAALTKQPAATSVKEVKQGAQKKQSAPSEKPWSQMTIVERMIAKRTESN